MYIGGNYYHDRYYSSAGVIKPTPTVKNLRMRGIPSSGQTSFWIVFNPSHNAPPRVGFWNENDAEKAAKDMAQKFPGDEFYVMQACSKALNDSVKFEKL